MSKAVKTTSKPLSYGQARAIATAYLPGRRLRGRRHYHYAWIKLASDPLYPGVCDALRGASAPLLDIGCGLGLLAHALRAEGNPLAYRGVDNDAGKITLAQCAARRRRLQAVAFESTDLACAVPEHRGSVTILDVLQFLSPEVQKSTLDAAIAMLTPGARLVIRTGLDDGGGRARITRAVDSLSRRLGWMNAGPGRYPDMDSLRQQFDGNGLQSEFTPLYGNTPFNNWRVLATRPV